MYKNFFRRSCTDLPRVKFDKMCCKSIEELNEYISNGLLHDIVPGVSKGETTEAFVRIPNDIWDNKEEPYIKSEEDRLGLLFHIYVFTYGRVHKLNRFRDIDKFKKQFDLGEKRNIKDIKDEILNKVLWDIKITYHVTLGFTLTPISYADKTKEINNKPKQIEIKEETEIQKIEKQLKQIEKKLGKNKAEKDKEYFELSKKLYNLKNPYHDPDEELPF